MTNVPYGYCHCGCGEKTRLASRTDRSIGQVEGEPLRFRKGHGRRGRHLWKYTVNEHGCWIWPSARPYPKTSHHGKSVYLHRFSHEKAHGPIPAGHDLDHLCRDTHCINPDHLEPVSHKVNMERSGPAQRTHCPHGHEYDETNTARSGAGSRYCRTCSRTRALAHYYDTKAAA